MSQLTTFVDCVQIQSDLQTAWNYNNLGHDGAAGLKFLLSSINKNGVDINQQINMKPNGLRTFQVIYPQRILESHVNDSGSLLCQGGETIGETYEDYTLDPSVGASEYTTITPADLRARCQRNPLFVAERVKMLMDACIEKADTDYLTFLANNLGNFAFDVDSGSPAGTNSFVTTSTRDTNKILIENAYQDVTFHFANNRFTNIPYGFGTKVWQDYARSKNAASVGQTGVNVNSYASQYPFGFGYSHKMATILGNANDAIFTAPGVTQMLWFNEFMGPDGSIDYFNNDGDVVQGVIAYPDPTIPLMFDYRAEYKCVAGTNQRYWEIGVAIAYDFAKLPDNMFQVGDRLEGVNGINKFRISNP